jgi:hypothetical protein
MDFCPGGSWAKLQTMSSTRKQLEVPHCKVQPMKVRPRALTPEIKTRHLTSTTKNKPTPHCPPTHDLDLDIARQTKICSPKFCEAFYTPIHCVHIERQEHKHPKFPKCHNFPHLCQHLSSQTRYVLSRWCFSIASLTIFYNTLPWYSPSLLASL